jgi:hypothetical protein
MTKKVVINLTQEQLKEMDDAYKSLTEKKITEDDYIAICAKFGCRPIDKRKDPLYEPGDNSSRVGFLWCCYNSERGKYFQNVMKIFIRKTLTQIHSLIFGNDGTDKKYVEYKDKRFTFLDKVIKDFSRDRMGKEDYSSKYTDYKKDLVNQSVNIVLWFANNDIEFRAKLLTFLNLFANKKTLFKLNEAEEFNNKKWG